MIFWSSIGIVMAENGTIPTTYKTYVDIGMGFYKVRDITNQTHKFEYQDRILNINQGDTVVWENDAERAQLTIVSEQGLWGSNVGSLRVGQQTSYKFDKTGSYDFYIKGSTDKRQKIVVSPAGVYVNSTGVYIDIPVTTPSPLPTIDKNIFTTPGKTYTVPSATNTPFPTVSYTKNKPIPNVTDTYGDKKGIGSIINIDNITNIVYNRNSSGTNGSSGGWLPKFINISATSIASIIVAILVLIVTFRSKYW